MGRQAGAGTQNTEQQSYLIGRIGGCVSRQAAAHVIRFRVRVLALTEWEVVVVVRHLSFRRRHFVRLQVDLQYYASTRGVVRRERTSARYLLFIFERVGDHSWQVNSPENYGSQLQEHDTQDDGPEHSTFLLKTISLKL